MRQTVEKFEFLLLLVSVAYILQFIVLAYLRMFYPFELEWIEGANVDEMRWIMQGNPLYGEPSISFIPLAYDPLFFFLSAALMKVVGVGFWAPRLISILSTLGCFLLLSLIVARDSEDPIPGVVAAGVYAASFRFTGAWMDLAKVDSLFLFLILAAFLVGRSYPNGWGMVFSGVLYVLAYLTKQLALLIILIMLPLALIESRGRTWVQVVSTVMVGLFIFWGLDKVSDGWFSFYSIHILTYHARNPDVWFFWRSLIDRMWPALLVGLAYPILWLVTRRVGLSKFKDFWLNLGLITAMLLASWSVFFKVWTYDNGFMPASAGLGLLAGLGYGRVLQLTRQSSLPLKASRLGCGAVVLLLLLQFAALFYNPLDQLPTAKDTAAAEQFINRIRSLPGDVWVFNHGFVNYLAGKNTYFHSVPYGDVVGGVYPPRTEEDRRRIEKVKQVFQQAITKQVFNWIIVDQPATSWLPYYLYVDKLFNDPKVFYPVTGARSRPESLMIRNPVAQGGEFPLKDSSFDVFLSDGWSAPEHWGRWAVGTRSRVRIALEQGYRYKIFVEAFPFCSRQPLEQTLVVRWNEHRLGKETFTSCEHHLFTFDLPSELVGKGLNDLWFEFKTAVSPAEVGLSEDLRPLAVGFISLAFAQEK